MPPKTHIIKIKETLTIQRDAETAQRRQKKKKKNHTDRIKLHTPTPQGYTHTQAKPKIIPKTSIRTHTHAAIDSVTLTYT